jgi:hypothetical protein
MKKTPILATLCAEGSMVVPALASAASCTAPNSITNGQVADASKVMQNFNTVADCVDAAPAGATGSVQINGGLSSFGAVRPLTNGQIVIGSTGAAPRRRQEPLPLAP